MSDILFVLTPILLLTLTLLTMRSKEGYCSECGNRIPTAWVYASDDPNVGALGGLAWNL